MEDLLLRNCHIVNAHEESFGSVLVGDGKVQAVLAATDKPEAAQVVDVGGRPVIPGVIDTHTHLGAARALDEDLKTESRSAAVSGVTTVLNFLMEMESYKKLIPAADEDIRKHSLIDVWHHAAIMTDEQFEEIGEYIQEYDIASFKFFMAYKGSEALPMIRGVDDGLLYDAFALLAKYPHVLPMVHAENIELVFRALEKAKSSGREDIAAWAEARPPIAEEEAQQRAWFLARHAGARLLVVHMSAGYTAGQLAKERRSYRGFYGETCPQYLGLDDSMDLGSFGKCNPPIRDRENSAHLWDALADGSIDFVGSDHATWGNDTKECSLWDASPGLPGMPAILPVLLSEGVNGGRLSMQKLVQITSYNAASIFGLLPEKGQIAVGSDADMTVLDMTWRRTFTPELVSSGVSWSPFSGIEYTGWPSMTVIGGRVVADRGEIVDGGGRGKRLRPHRS